jgi:hypothetical protein
VLGFTPTLGQVRVATLGMHKEVLKNIKSTQQGDIEEH